MNTPAVAIDLAGNLGWRVHPCNGKVPLLKDWPELATANLDGIDQLFAPYPGASVGIATGAASGIVVADIDDLEAFGAFCHEHKLEMPPTPTATTPSGGVHYYFAHPGGTVPNRVKFVPGADIRGDGGQVIAPGQPGRSWAPSLSPGDVEPAPLPAVLLEAIQTRQTSTAPPVGDEIPDGQRNDALASLAGTMRRRGMAEEEILAALVAVNANRCRPPLAEAEVRAIAHSVGRYEAAAPVAAAEPAAVGFMLRELYERPELLEPPPAIVPGFIYADRFTVLPCREKGGKSTLMGFLAADCSHYMRVLWLGLEEPLGDPVRRFKLFGADPDNVLIIDRLVGGHADALNAIDRFDPPVIFLDSLSKWGDGVVTDWNASAQVTPLMAQLAEVCHHGHRAILASHHAKKSDGHYRDSTAIGANADLLLEMFPDEADPNVRRFSPMGRMTLEPFALCYTGSGFEQVGGHVAVRDRVLAFVEANPDSSKRRIREAIRGSNPLVDQALDQLARDGLIADHGTESRSQFNVTENGRGTVAARSAARCGDGGETQWGTVSARYRHGDGHRPCPVPLRVYGAPRSPDPTTGLECAGEPCGADQWQREHGRDLDRELMAELRGEESTDA